MRGTDVRGVCMDHQACFSRFCVDVKGTYVDGKGAGVRVKGACVDVKGTCVDVKGTCVDRGIGWVTQELGALNGTKLSTYVLMQRNSTYTVRDPLWSP